MSDKNNKGQTETNRVRPTGPVEKFELRESTSTKHYTNTLKNSKKQKQGEKTRIVDKPERDGHSRKDDTSSGDRS